MPTRMKWPGCLSQDFLQLALPCPCEVEAKAPKQQQQQHQDHQLHDSSTNSLSNLNANSEITKSKRDCTASSSSITLTDEQKIDDLNLPKQEVICRFRLLKQNRSRSSARLDRLKYVLKPEGGPRWDMSGDGGSSEADHDKDLNWMKANFEDLYDEDKILVFFKRLLNEWKQELDEMSGEEDGEGEVHCNNV
ncbi:splicing factor Prp18 family protein [Actinidia rufa]|uniref:Splicing factor Prp18 family protein n=1 Tax=Actinidia rufa TaxID=165716 RepID=A0A7J0G1T7_9ERIC|nr:splicing factor Prp18 family protein [Actinidia rufa]